MDGILPWVLVNGALVPADVARVGAFDRGYLYADGVFETMRVRAGAIDDLEAHLDRLARGAAALGFAAPARERLAADLAELVARHHLGVGSSAEAEAILRVTVSAAARGTDAPSVVAFLRPVDERIRLRRRGLALYRAPEPLRVRAEPAPLAGHKTLAYVTNVAAQRLHPAGARPDFEAAFLDRDERLLEGATTNLFALTAEGVVVTAPADGAILPGVTRARALGLLARLGIPTRLARVPWSELALARELFATSSTLPVAPIIRLEDEPRPVAADGVVALLQRHFDAGA